MEAALSDLRNGKNLTGKDGILTPLIKQLTEAAMEAELEAHLTDELERKVLGLFSLGNSYQDIRSHIAELYDIRLSNGTLNAAEQALNTLEATWGKRYPLVIKSWRTKWATLSTYFQYPENVRKIIYTTNAVEAVHRQFRKLTKTKGGFADENSLLKLLYAGMLKATKRWSRPVSNWNLALSQLAIHFPGRLDPYMDL